MNKTMDFNERKILSIDGAYDRYVTKHFTHMTLNPKNEDDRRMFYHRLHEFERMENMYLWTEVFLKQLESRYGQLDIVMFENVIYINHVCDNKQCDIGTISTKNEFGSYYKVDEKLLRKTIKDWGQEKSFDEQWRNISVIIKDFRDKKLRLFNPPEPEPEQPKRYRRTMYDDDYYL